jgi:hypothetical protein
MRSMRKLAAGMVLCLLTAGCGSSASKRVATSGSAPVAAPAPPTTTTPYHLATTFKGGYQQAWGEMKQVGAEVAGAINQVKLAHAKHQTVPDTQLASEFATFASHFEPALVEFQGLTPPASIAGPYKSMSTAAVGMEGSLRNFSADANASRATLAEHDLANYFAYAVTIDKAATKIFHRLGIK